MGVSCQKSQKAARHELQSNRVLLSGITCRTNNFGLPTHLTRLYVIMQSCNDYILDSQKESGFGAGGVNIYDIFADVWD